MLLKIGLTIFSLLLIVGGYILMFPQETIGQCWGFFAKYGEVSECRSNYLILGRILNTAGIYLLPVTFFLFFTSKKALQKLAKFSTWFIPIAILLVILQPERRVTLDPSLPGQITATIWLSTIFLIVSALIIFFNNRKK